MKVPCRSQNKFKKNYKNILFIHIPKTGGSFVESTFGKYAQKSPTLSIKAARGHLTYREYELVFRQNSLDIGTFHTFCVVRNPWAWHFSWFNYLKNDKDGLKSGMPLEHYLFQSFSFNDYVEWLTQPDRHLISKGYMHYQQKDFIVNDEGDVVVNEVLKQEELYTELQGFVRKHNLSIVVKDKSVNVSTKDDYRAHYSDSSIEIIEQKHADDIRLFNYAFDA